MTSIDHGVGEWWEHVDAWLRAHVRKSPVRSAVDAARLGVVEAGLGVTLPADVREWWMLSQVSAGCWIPGSFAPVELEEALETRKIWLLVAEQEESLAAENGEDHARFLPEFLPIAMSPGGDGLIVDLRPGRHHGAIYVWDHERWGLGVALWDSVSAMLQDIAGALESHTPALARHAALGGAEAARTGKIDDSGDLDWEPAGR